MKPSREELEELKESGFNVSENIDIDVDNLTEAQLLDDKTILEIFEIENSELRDSLLVDLEIRADRLHIKTAFNNKRKLCREIFIKNQKSKNQNQTAFKDCLYPTLQCGQWIANENGIYKKNYNPKSTFQINVDVIKASPIPITIVERLINIETKIEKIKLAFFKDGKWQEILVEKNAIASKNKILQLANRGIEVTEENAKNLISYLADLLELNPIYMRESVSHLGWIGNNFVPYNNQYCLDIDFEFQQKIASIKSSSNNNDDYEKWKQYMKNLRAKSKTLRFMMASSFASVLLETLNLNTFIVHLWGKSGNGKTVAEMVCASIWGKPDGNLISNLSNTTIANERLCNFYRNIPIFLDELQIAKTRYRNFDEIIYTLTEGKGKERGNVDNGIRELTTWRNIILITGEEPITSDTSKEGVKNRVIEINEDDMIIENGNDVVNFIQNNYGFAGQDFIRLISNREKINEMYQSYVNELSKTIEYQKQINAYAVILIADNIISNELFNDISLTIDDIKGFERKDTDETDRIYDLIKDWIAQNNKKFITDNCIPAGDIYGECKENIVYIITTTLKNYLSENNINFNGIKNKLFEKGYILKSANGDISGVKKINNASCRCIQFIIKEDTINENNDNKLPF